MKAIKITMLLRDTAPNKALILELQSKYTPLMITEQECEYFER